jgi:hypothetical protein
MMQRHDGRCGPSHLGTAEHTFPTSAGPPYLLYIYDGLAFHAQWDLARFVLGTEHARGLRPRSSRSSATTPLAPSAREGRSTAVSPAAPIQ